jgi:hypothetical protein
MGDMSRHLYELRYSFFANLICAETALLLQSVVKVFVEPLQASLSLWSLSVSRNTQLSPPDVSL